LNKIKWDCANNKWPSFLCIRLNIFWWSSIMKGR
jgi:hypothetical protein